MASSKVGCFHPYSLASIWTSCSYGYVVGCYIGTTFAGALAYADDVSLLAPTRNSLLRMLSVVKDFSRDFDVNFNASKSKLLVFSTSSDGTVPEQITFDGDIIPCVENDIHLGNPVGMGASGHIVKVCTDNFICKVNATLANFKFAHSDTLYTLFKTFCMTLYGCPLWDCSSKEVDYFYTTWRKCVRRVWRLPSRTHNELLHLICGDKRAEGQVHLRLAKFLKSLAESDNSVVGLCLQLSLRGSRSSVANSVSLLSHRYGWIRESLLSGELGGLTTAIRQYGPLTTDNDGIASTIRELVFMRDRNSGPLSKDEATLIIDMLCLE